MKDKSRKYRTDFSFSTIWSYFIIKKSKSYQNNLFFIYKNQFKTKTEKMNQLTAKEEPLQSRISRYLNVDGSHFEHL